MNDERPPPDRGFWSGVGWAVLIVCGIVLLVAAAFEMWGW